MSKNELTFSGKGVLCNWKKQEVRMATPRKNNKTNGSRTQLREEILNGHYLAGTYLPSARELAKSLNVSKSSVHNILKLLQEEGLIQIYPNCGALVLENGASRNMLKRFFVRPSDFGTFRYLPVSMELLAGIAAGAEKKNCEMLTSFSDSGRMTDEIIAHCMNGLIQGMIYLQCDNFDGLIAPLEKAAVPYVIAADNRGHAGALRTYVDYRAAARNAVRFLIGRGHRRIGIVTGAVRDYLYAEMLAGFRGALAEEDVPLNPDWVLSDLGYEQSADQVGVLMNFLKQPELPTAIFTVRDYRAGWLFEAAGRLGIGIPGQLSVLSFDNHSWRGAEVSGLTTFAEPLREQGETAVELLRQWVASGKRPESVELKPELVERASVAALP